MTKAEFIAAVSADLAQLPRLRDDPLPPLSDETRARVLEVAGAIADARAALGIAHDETLLLHSDYDGEVSLENWVPNSPRRLSLFVLGRDVWFLKSWGAHMFTEMDDGDDGDDGDLEAEVLELWRWLYDLG